MIFNKNEDRFDEISKKLFANFNDIKTPLINIMNVVVWVMGAVTGVLAMVGTISCGIAAWNNKQDLGEHIKKWVIGVAIAGLATTVMGIVKSSIGNAKIDTTELIIESTVTPHHFNA